MTDRYITEIHDFQEELKRLSPENDVELLLFEYEIAFSDGFSADSFLCWRAKEGKLYVEPEPNASGCDVPLAACALDGESWNLRRAALAVRNRFVAEIRHGGGEDSTSACGSGTREAVGHSP